MVVLAMSGCAGVTHVPVRLGPPPPHDTRGREERIALEKKADGIRYYGGSLYMIVNSTAKGTIQWRLIELPDQTKLMSARPYNYLATLDATLQFENGVLRQSHQAADGTVVPRAAIASAVQVAASAARFAAVAAAADRNPRVYLYKLVPTSKGLAFRGENGTCVNITIDPAQAQPTTNPCPSDEGAQ
jgi:hypothetical protein